jgi:hypothetical protein
MKTLASYREKVKVEQLIVPEDMTDGEVATPCASAMFSCSV